MKQKTLFFLFIFAAFSLLLCEMIEANESFELVIAKTKNPFTSSLPKIEEIVEKTPEPININIEAPPEPREKPEYVSRRTIEKEPEPIIVAPKLVISGLIWNTELPQAIINQSIVTVGDIVDDSQIVNIHKDGVDVLFSGKNFTIKIDQTLTQSI